MTFLVLFQSGKGRLSSSRGNNAAYDGEETGALDLGILQPGKSGSPVSSDSEVTSGTSKRANRLANQSPESTIEILGGTSEEERDLINPAPTETTTENIGNVSKKDGDITGSVTNT